VAPRTVTVPLEEPFRSLIVGRHEMGKAARTKAARRTAPPPVGKQQPRVTQRSVLLITVGAAVVVAIVVGVLVVTRSSSKPPPAAAPSQGDRNAPAALVAAADKVGFKPNTEPGVGLIESQPAAAAQPATNQSLVAVGAAAPAFALQTPEGGAVSLHGLRGKTTLLEFFATWCPHCAAEAPHLEQIFSGLLKTKYAFVAINADGEDAASVFAFHRYFGLTYPVLLDPSSHAGNFHSAGAAGPVTTAYKVEAFPTFYIVDAKGRIAWRSDGEQPDALLRQELNRTARA
jgi:peroxiredoxin